MGHNLSYVWSSIFNGKFIVCAGSRWCIGSGANIAILEEPWLVDGGRIYCANQGSFHFRNTTVDNLIDNTNKAWSQEFLSIV